MTETDEPEFVYHYTTMDAMMSIARTESIWATNISYLNDTSEGKHFLRLIGERLPEYLRKNTGVDERLLRGIESSDQASPLIQPFIASFSGAADSLPQWRSYCPNGNGVAIGFSVDCLKRAELHKSTQGLTPAVTFGKVDYVDHSSVELLDQEIGDAIREAQILTPDPGRLPGAGFFSYLLRRRATLKKNRSFSNEHEYRLVVDPIYDKSDLLRFRSTRSSLVPFLEVSIPRERSNAEARKKNLSEQALPHSSTANFRHFIDRVIVCPTSNMELSVHAVKGFFKTLLMRVRVDASEIPYRDW